MNHMNHIHGHHVMTVRSRRVSISVLCILVLIILASCVDTEIGIGTGIGTGTGTGTAPAGLTDLEVAEELTTPDSVELTWSQPTDFGTTNGKMPALFGSYTVKVYQGADEGGSEVEGLTLTPTSLDKSTVSVRVSGLSSKTQYAFQLVLSNDNDPSLSSYSNVVSATTTEAGAPTAPADLTDLAVAERLTTADSVELTWSQPTDFGTTNGKMPALFGSYTVKVYQGADEGGSEVEGLTLTPTSLDKSTVSVRVSGLSSKTQYAFQLVLSNGNDPPLSSYSNVVSETPQDPRGRIWNEVSVNGDWFSARSFHATVVFDSKLWVIGGRIIGGGTSGTTDFDDVWSSSDGKIWTEETEGVTSTRFSERNSHAAVVFENKIWVIGGLSGTTRLNDVWSSSDGKIWTEETEGVTTPRFSERSSHAAAVFDNKLWVIGGNNPPTNLNDVWSSSDGKIWTEETEGVTSTRFSTRHTHTAVVFDSKLWVIGGGSSSIRKNDVWSSSDGKSWTEETEGVTSTRFSELYLHAAAVSDGKLWVIGGFDGTLSDDVWSSSDGKSWTEVTKDVNVARFSGRYGHTVAVFGNKFWLIGGSASTFYNDVWYSP